MEPADPAGGPLFAAPATHVPPDALMQLPVLVRDVLLRPGAAMRRLAEHPDRRWLAPLVALIAVSVAGVLAGRPAMLAHDRQLERARAELAAATVPAEVGPVDVEAMGGGAEQLSRIMTAVGLVGAVVGTALTLAVLAALLHLLGTVVGGQQTFTQMLTVTSWARLPLVLLGVLWTVAVLAGHWDPNPQGLAGLVAPDPLDPAAARSYTEPLLAQVHVWNLWYLGLLALAVRAASRVSLRKAWLVVGLLVALEVGLGMAAVAVMRTLTGALG